MAMDIKIWGARGSLPSPHTPDAMRARMKDVVTRFAESGMGKKSALSLDHVEPFLASLPQHLYGGFGGNTPCIEVRAAQQRAIIDGGSGIRPLGYELLRGPCGKGQGEVHILFTHFHWDHLIGLPFFVPIFIPGNKIHFYAVQPELEEVIRTIFKKPFFPVPFEYLGAEISFHRLEPRKPKAFGDLMATPYQLDHPDPCWGFRFEREGMAYAHCVDTEASRVTPEELGPDLPLYQNVDLMVFDAQYTLMETIEKIDWGHAAASIGLDLAMREGVKRMLFMHHDPASSDEKIAEAEAEARRYYDSQLRAAKRAGKKIHEVEWSFATEGMVIPL
ncbi:MAG: MBL fold metallo-hydrolase [Bdellovibrionales bacterium]|nr:MBL fold metallo-hydrolase [Bdellovibrionales bacterium]